MFAPSGSTRSRLDYYVTSPVAELVRIELDALQPEDLAYLRGIAFDMCMQALDAQYMSIRDHATVVSRGLSPVKKVRGAAEELEPWRPIARECLKLTFIFHPCAKPQRLAFVCFHSLY